MVGIRTVFSRGWHDATQSFGGRPSVIGLIAIPLLTAALYWWFGTLGHFKEFYSLAIYGLASTGAVFIALLGWKISAAPYRLQRDRADAEKTRADRAESQIQHLSEHSALPNAFLQSLSDTQSEATNLRNTLNIVAVLAEQYRRLLSATLARANFMGRDLEVDDLIIMAKFLADETQALLPNTPFRPDEPLIFQTGWNQYRYIFSVPMRVPPEISFPGIDQSIEATVLRVSKIDFEAIFFHKPSLNKQQIGPQRFAASAEL